MPLFKLLRAILRFFGLQEHHIAQIVVKSGTEESNEGDSLTVLHGKFYPIGAGVGAWTPKLKILWNFKI